jgi:hypothetical protein
MSIVVEIDDVFGRSSLVSSCSSVGHAAMVLSAGLGARASRIKSGCSVLPARKRWVTTKPFEPTYGEASSDRHLGSERSRRD